MRFIFLLLVSLSLLSESAYGIAKYRPMKDFKSLRRELRKGDLAESTDKTIKGMIELAVSLLGERGFYQEAASVEVEFKDRWEGYFVRAHMRGLGDHKPYSEWLALTYDLLRLTLGDQVLKFWHLDDLYILNYAIPVVFDPENPDWDKKEYGLHFVPFSGVLTYWTIWIGCEIYTFATGHVFPCSPAGSLGETIMVHLFAPHISNMVYNQANKL